MFEEIDVHNVFFPSNRLPSINRNIPFDKPFSKRDLLGTEQLTKRCLNVYFTFTVSTIEEFLCFTGANLFGGCNISFSSNFPTMETFVFLRQW